MNVAIIGTAGVPAGYGGFETLAENLIGEHCSPEISYTVFCSGRCAEKPETYKGAKLKYVNLSANGMMSIIYDVVCLLRSLRGYDVILILGTSGCLFLPIFRLLCRRKVIVNIDGLEHRREKWGRFARWFLRASEAVAVRFADTIIADNKGIQDYVHETYGKEAELIAYGGDHVVRSVDEEQEVETLELYGLSPRQYAITVCRIEPENNCHMTLEAFATTSVRLLFIGNWERSDYGKLLREKYREAAHLLLQDPVYDLDQLYVLRKHSRYYIHGHSAGGTNPSLVESMFCGCNILAYDCVYNRETTENGVHYFRTSQELAELLAGSCTDNSQAAIELGLKSYMWTDIVRKYEKLY